MDVRINNIQTAHSGSVYSRDYVIDYTSLERDDLMIFAEGDGQLDYVQREVYAGSERIEQFTDRSNGGYERLLYVHEDLMGNTRYYTKANGQSYAELTYDAWGMPESPNKLLNNDHGNYVYATYTGHIFDTTLDIYFAEARFYDANTRTWLAMDPIKDGGNWYQYCNSNPVTYWDPLGLAAYDPGQPWANRNQPYSSTSSIGRFTTYGGCDSAMPLGMKYSQAQAAGVTIDIGAILSDPRFQAAVKVIDGAGQTIAGITLLTAVVAGTGGFGVVGLVIFGAAGATSTVFGINDAVEGVLDARDIYQQGSVSGDNNFLRSHLPDGVYYAVDVTSELVTSFGVGMAVGNKSAQKVATLESGSTPKVHGNSKLSTKPQHGYEIYNTETGDVVKTGISGQKLNINRTSPRANSQINKLNKSTGKQLYDARIVTTDMPNRLSALEWERENALRLWNEGNSMSLHKRPRPWEE